MEPCIRAEVPPCLTLRLSINKIKRIGCTASFLMLKYCKRVSARVRVRVRACVRACMGVCTRGVRARRKNKKKIAPQSENKTKILKKETITEIP